MSDETTTPAADNSGAIDPGAADGSAAAELEIAEALADTNTPADAAAPLEDDPFEEGGLGVVAIELPDGGELIPVPPAAEMEAEELRRQLSDAREALTNVTAERDHWKAEAEAVKQGADQALKVGDEALAELRRVNGALDSRATAAEASAARAKEENDGLRARVKELESAAAGDEGLVLQALIIARGIPSDAVQAARNLVEGVRKSIDPAPQA